MVECDGPVVAGAPRHQVWVVREKVRFSRKTLRIPVAPSRTPPSAEGLYAPLRQAAPSQTSWHVPIANPSGSPADPGNLVSDLGGVVWEVPPIIRHLGDLIHDVSDIIDDVPDIIIGSHHNIADISKATDRQPEHRP